MLTQAIMVAGELMVWWAIGIVMWLGYSVFAQWNVGEAPPSWLPLLAGGILICAGAYQSDPLQP